jgi:glycosyltransferase involved in cell wall biosynthesis
MKIILTTHVFLPDFSGGTEVLTHSVARDLRSRGHEVLVVTGFPKHYQPEKIGGFDEYVYDDIRVVRFLNTPASYEQQSSIVELDYANQSNSAKFAQLLDRFQAEFVYCFHIKRLSAVILDECIRRHIPFSVIVTDYWYLCPVDSMVLENGKFCPGPDAWSLNCLKHLTSLTQPKWFTKVISHAPQWILIKGIQLGMSMKRIVGRSNNISALAARQPFIKTRLNHADKIYFATNYMMERFIEHGIERHRVVHLPFGINQSGYTHRVRTYRGGEQKIVFGYIGQALPHKGLDVLIKAFLEIPRKMICELRIYSGIGEKGSYAKECQEMAASDNRIRFLGRFKNVDMAKIINEIEVLVIPSVWSENLPLVLLTAQAVACPVIASDIPGISEIITNQENGLLFRPGNDQELLRHLLSIMEQPRLLGKLSSGAASNIKTITQYVDALLQS